MRSRLLFLSLLLIVVGFLIGLQVCHAADLPLVIVQPNGQITYVYPGRQGLPTVTMPSTGGPPTYVWPGTSTAPVLPVPVPIAPSMPALPGWPQ